MVPLFPIFVLALVSPSLPASAEEWGEQCQEESKIVPGDMVNITDCTRCLSAPRCIWCERKRSHADPLAIGCVKRGSLECPEDDIKEADAKVDEKGSTPLSKTVMIFPQTVRLTTSPNHEAKVKFEVELADVPVDIYFLMDLSQSMDEHKQNLFNTASAISDRVTELTSGAQFGFGSFSDKPTPPFSKAERYYNETVPVPYSFEHKLSLTSNITAFGDGVKSSTLTGNLDYPESSLDALMQVITCGTEIGWREGVRKIVFLITDEEPHYAYDGILGGLVQPQDSRCHLSRSNGASRYSGELQMDYPSFGQIREQLNKENMAVIFAVKGFMKSLYENLSKFIQGENYVEMLTKDATSLQEIVTEQYKKIRGTIKLELEHDADDVAVTLDSDCEEASDDHTRCTVGDGKRVSYEATVTIGESVCSDPDPAKRKIEISLKGLGGQSLMVELACQECDCGDPANEAGECTGHGTLVCGGCECHEGFSGRRCECDGGNGGEAGSERCEVDEGEGGEVCGGAGRCKCGRCLCDPQHLGENCECERDSCPKGKDGLTCSGNGACKCNSDLTTKCSCHDPWTGDNCDCTTDTAPCKDAATGLTCFGRGTCECGRCKCEEGFEGKYCQHDKGHSTCERLEPCVKAFLYKDTSNGSPEYEDWKSECQAAKKDLAITEIYKGCDSEDLKCTAAIREGEFEKDLKGTARRCTGSLGGCQLTFHHNGINSDEFLSRGESEGLLVAEYKQLDNGTWTERTQCSSVPLAVIIGSTVGSLFFVGICVIVTAVVLINLNDYRNFKRYEAMRSELEGKLNDIINPLYEPTKGSETTFMNPGYGGQ